MIAHSAPINTPPPQILSPPAGNHPYVTLSPMATSGIFTAPHPPSQHAYQYWQSFDWPGFDHSTANGQSIMDCIKLAILYDVSVFAYNGNTQICHFKKPLFQRGATMVYPSNSSIPCTNGKPGCLAMIQDADFINAYGVLDKKGHPTTAKAKDPLACARMCNTKKSICAMATFFKGKCTMKQPIKTKDSAVYAGVVWFLKGGM
ncbi:hypothetical protein BCR33DRAFT_251382 [Rhizoclosmatium globosum]|uniref:Uncharacterized protein n=1 Tax=Rhizoclosmatium globosum TaxID=329046 RepID=A0A1Y2CA03_9FUNG|nr:hypothetical protein BCR33DRAFT_251382 [Rhizoclosmatium globosum]|eukprot:ORY43859.1 hypothetical protein BCR33DRAFT_251382 [Rhizoclosmatium globosum]